MLPLDGYVRVSRVGKREGDGFISPKVQEDAIQEWAKKNGVRVEMQPHELNVSGGKMDRPVFNTIMRRIANGESGGFVVYKLDRFARTLLGALTTIEEIGKHSGTFASVTEPQLDYSTPAGRAFVQQMFVFAEFVRSTLKESWAVSQREAIERGIHISPTTYLGFDKGDDGRLVPNDEADIAREVFVRRGALGEGWGTIAEWLNDVAPKPNGTLWTGTSVARLCAKRVYVGEASRYIAQDVDGRGAMVNADAHPPIVTEDEWQAAQMNQASRRGGSNGNPLPLLSGLIRCAGCRFAMSQGRGPKGERMYRCRHHHASGTCPEPASIIADRLEEWVESTILLELDTQPRATLVADDEERDLVATEVDNARADLAAFQGDTLARRKLGDAGWHESLDHYLKAVRDAEGRLIRLNARMGGSDKKLTRNRYLALSQDKRGEVLAGFIDAVFVRPSRGRGRNADPLEKRAVILFRGEAPADIPRQRVTSPVVRFEWPEDDIEPGVVAA